MLIMRSSLVSFGFSVLFAARRVLVCIGCVYIDAGSGALGARLWCGLVCLAVVVGTTGDAERMVVAVVAVLATVAVVAAGTMVLFATALCTLLFARSGLPCRDLAFLIVPPAGFVLTLVVVVVILGAVRGDRGDLARVVLAVLILRPVIGSYLASFAARLLRARRTCGVVAVLVVVVVVVPVLVLVLLKLVLV